MTPFVWSQILALGAFACGVASFQCRQRRSVLLWLTSLALLNALHFFLLDRPGPGIMLTLTAGRYVTAIFTQQRGILLLFLVAAFFACFQTYSGPLSLLSLLAVVLGTCGSFQRSDRIMRVCFMGGNSTWLTHNLLAWTPVAALMEAAFLTSNIVGYCRFYVVRRQPPIPATRSDLDSDSTTAR